MADQVEITVDAGRCAGSLACVRRAPGMFLIDDHESQAVPISPQPSDVLPALVGIAAGCPTGAIGLRRVDGAGAGPAASGP